MGLFGDDKRQDERLDALEAHIRVLTESAQQNELDIAETQITLMETKSVVGQLQDQVGQKLSVDEIDPMLGKLNEQLGSARDRLNEVSRAADESWVTLHGSKLCILPSLSLSKPAMELGSDFVRISCRRNGG